MGVPTITFTGYYVVVLLVCGKTTGHRNKSDLLSNKTWTDLRTVFPSFAYLPT